MGMMGGTPAEACAGAQPSAAAVGSLWSVGAFRVVREWREPTLSEEARMSSTPVCQRDVWSRAARKGRRPATGLRALLGALRRWWATERYRPERRYMRG